MAQRPAAPTLSATPKPQAVRIDFAVPTDGEIHAAVHLHDADRRGRACTTATGAILPAGETGQVIVFKAGAQAQAPHRRHGPGAGTFTATVCFRRPGRFRLGPNVAPQRAARARAGPGLRSADAGASLRHGD